MKFVQVCQCVRQRADACGIRDKNAKICKVGQENRKNAEGIRRNVQLFEIGAKSKNRGQRAQEVGGYVQGQE